MGKRSRTHRRYEKPHLLSLSGDILNDIGDRLDEQDLCNMELACRTLNSVLSTPSGTGLCGRVLDLRTGRLRALSPEASRWSFYKLSVTSQRPSAPSSQWLL